MNTSAYLFAGLGEPLIGRLIDQSGNTAIAIVVVGISCFVGALLSAFAAGSLLPCCREILDADSQWAISRTRVASKYSSSLGYNHDHGPVSFSVLNFNDDMVDIFCLLNYHLRNFYRKRQPMATKRAGMTTDAPIRSERSVQ